MTNNRAKVTVEDVVAEVRESRKYRTIAPDLVGFVARAEAPKEKSRDAAVKRVKRRLHQVVGAYLDAGMPFESWLAELRAVAGTPDVHRVIAAVLKHHASTRERLPVMPEFYTQIFDGLPPPRMVMDLACGLGPLSRPLWAVPQDTALRVYDVVSDMVDFVVQAVGSMGYAIEGGMWNLLEGPPPGGADVALLLKTIPCLMQADKPSAHRLLAQIDAPTVIVSFPTRSLTGREKGMGAFYDASFRDMVAGLPFDMESMEIGNELVFRLRRNS